LKAIFDVIVLYLGSSNKPVSEEHSSLDGQYCYWQSMKTDSLAAPQTCNSL